MKDFEVHDKGFKILFPGLSLGGLQLGQCHLDDSGQWKGGQVREYGEQSSGYCSSQGEGVRDHGDGGSEKSDMVHILKVGLA